MSIASIALPRILRIGGGASKELPDVLATLGLSRPLIVTDAFLLGSGRVQDLQDVLAGAGIASRVFARKGPELVVSGFAAAQSNTVFVGVPMILKAYGDAGAVPLGLLLAIHLPVTMTVATLLAEGRTASIP